MKINRKFLCQIFLLIKFSSRRFLAYLLPCSLLLFSSAKSQAQSNSTGSGNAYEFNINFGTMISARIGIDETVPGWGLRTSIPTSKGIFEVGGFSGIGNGAIYRSAAFDYRMDVLLETIASHFLLGFHADQYEASTPSPVSSKFSGGWHYGGGVIMPITGPVSIRFDFRHRFSPGQALEVTLGFSYKLTEFNK